MAQSDGSQQSTGAQSRVTTQADVHVRHVGAAVRSETSKTVEQQEPRSEKMKKKKPVVRREGARKGAIPKKGDVRESAPKKRRIWLRVLLVMVGLLVLVAVSLVAWFAWDRWWRYDDAADVQGKWYAAGSTTPVTITDSKIIFDAETSYVYEIDPQSKTIRYTLASLEGEGRYWFDDARETLVIVDGKGFTAFDTVRDDIVRLIGRIDASLNGVEADAPSGDGVTVLTREPDADALSAEIAAATEAALAERRAEAEARALAEAEERERAEAEAGKRSDADSEPESAVDGEGRAEGAEGSEDEADARETSGEEGPSERDFSSESAGVFGET